MRRVRDGRVRPSPERPHAASHGAAHVPLRNNVSGAAGQFCAPPKPFMASVITGGLSMICEKRTTVTMSSIETARP